MPPLHLTWSWLGADSGSTESIGQDGSVLLALGPSTAGSDELVVRATDELGESSSNVSSSTAVEPPLAGGGAVSVSSSGPGARVDVSGWVEAGDAPFDWTIVPQGSVTAESPGGGTLPTVGTFRWNASSADPARFAATLFLIDAEGARVAYPISATGGSGLSVGIVAGPAGLGHWSGVVTVVGGSPPFRSWANASDGRSWNRSNLSNRSWPVSGSTSGPGNLSVVVTVVDRYGDRAVAETAFVVPATARSRPYAAQALGGVLGAGLLGGGAYAYWRRRARATPGPEVADPVAVLRSIIAPADGIERSTAEQLAEEEGVPRERARATLDRLVADGSVRAERGVDGEEILAWRPIP